MNLDSKPIEKNLESLCIVWLSDDVNYNGTMANFPRQLKAKNVANQLKIFLKIPDCINYIRDITKERVILIVSSIEAVEILADIHDFPRLNAVYMFCIESKAFTDISKKYKKVS